MNYPPQSPLSSPSPSPATPVRQFPTMLPSHSSLWRRFRTLPQLGQVGIGCGVLLVLSLCSCSSLVIVLAANGAGSTAPQSASSAHGRIGAHTPVVAHATATRKPSPTATQAPRATATPAPSGSPVLGGPGSAFITQYGPLTTQSDTSSGDLHFRQYPGVAQDFLIVDLAEHFGETPANDAESILVQAPPGQAWDTSTAQATCSVFFPADAQKVNDVPVVSAGALVGEDVIYTSATLAQTFPASVFVDASQNPVTPGTFDVMYLYAQNGTTSTIDSCQLLLGSQQTQD
ncbi:MAG TPA: hypothetical protein VKQ36_01435 [Ktedonobacterales bacterium]|nr:hypothetical protein [Ktedonobacterales bacterium]